MFPIENFGQMESDVYQVQDLLSGATYTWRGRRNYVELDPDIQPAHIFLGVAELGLRVSQLGEAACVDPSGAFASGNALHIIYEISGMKIRVPAVCPRGERVSCNCTRSHSHTAFWA